MKLSTHPISHWAGGFDEVCRHADFRQPRPHRLRGRIGAVTAAEVPHGSRRNIAEPELVWTRQVIPEVLRDRSALDSFSGCWKTSTPRLAISVWKRRGVVNRPRRPSRPSVIGSSLLKQFRCGRAFKARVRWTRALLFAGGGIHSRGSEGEQRSPFGDPLSHPRTPGPRPLARRGPPVSAPGIVASSQAIAYALPHFVDTFARLKLPQTPEVTASFERFVWCYQADRAWQSTRNSTVMGSLSGTK